MLLLSFGDSILRRKPIKCHWASALMLMAGHSLHLSLFRLLIQPIRCLQPPPLITGYLQYALKGTLRPAENLTLNGKKAPLSEGFLPLFAAAANFVVKGQQKLLGRLTRHPIRRLLTRTLTPCFYWNFFVILILSAATAPKILSKSLFKNLRCKKWHAFRLESCVDEMPSYDLPSPK